MAEEKQKPGWRTTEFWLNVGIAVLSFILAGFGISEEDTLHKILTLASSAFVGLGATYSIKGYSTDRTALKLNKEQSEVLKQLPPST